MNTDTDNTDKIDQLSTVNTIEEKTSVDKVASKVSSDISSSNQLTNQELLLLRSLKADWFLWEIDAIHPVERKEFNEIVDYLKKHESLSIPTGKLLELNIHPARSSLLRKLAKSQKANITRDFLTLSYTSITKENLSSEMRKIEDVFSNMMKKTRESYIKFPTSHFRIIDRDCINTIPLEKIGWKNLNTKQYKGKLLEITFSEKKYPPILITSSEYQYLQRVSTNKIIYRLEKLAGEDPDFFTHRIEVDKKRMSAQYPRLFDFDMMRLNKSSSRGYREQYTAIVMEKLFSNKNLTKMMLVDFDSESNSHIMRYFPSSSPTSFDFLQSFTYLKEIYLHSDINNAIQINTISKMIFESIKMYLTLDEIHSAIYEDFPELAETQFEQIMSKFFDEYVNKKNRHGIPQVFNFKIITDDKIEQDVFIHHLNLNRIINGALERIENKIPALILSDWEKLLTNHRMHPAMVSNRHFSLLVLKYLSTEESFIYKILRKPSIYRILESLDQLSRLTIRLKLYTHNEIDKVFNLNKDKIYNAAFENIVSHKSFFAKLIFMLINWFQKKSFDPDAEEDHEKTDAESTIHAITDGKHNKVDFLNAVNAESEENLMQKSDNLWAKLPDSLNKKEIDQNIRADLFGFFRQRKEVPIFALKYIVENNVNRILKKGQHLMSYKNDLTEYIRNQVWLTVFKNSHLRRKVNISVRASNNK